MCGIFGIAYRDGITVPDESSLVQTGQILHHRGPDSIGIHRAAGVGLVQTRLSLIDLSSRSDQPFWDDERRYVIVYNGEIYNFRALRNDLEHHGVSFRTTSDTEVLLKGIICFGLETILPKLEGMFAFGLWDSQERSLVLVRDRFGIKPLSVYENDHMLVFASEIKAMQPWIPLTPDIQTVSAYLAGFGGPTRDRSFFHNVTILAPGTIRELRLGRGSEQRTFFHITDFWTRNGHLDPNEHGPDKVVDRFEELLLKSVQKHLIADAPVGALCSGGLDSSLVMAMASRFHSNLAIFHADVTGPLSEYHAAKALAKHLRLDMRTVRVCDRDFIEQLPRVTQHYEYPFIYHPNSVPFLLVSRLVRANGVKAVLSGEGSDECFLGYGKIALEDVRQRYRRAILRFRDFVQRIPTIGRELWPPPQGYSPLVHNLEQNFEITFDRSRIGERVASQAVRFREREFRSLEWLGYHLRTLLHRNDALGMAASIEARFPYLDHALVCAAVNLPYEFKIRPSLVTLDRAHPFLCDKWVIRRVADRYIPKNLSRRKKLGFPVNAYDRMQVSAELFRNGFVAELYKLREAEFLHLFNEADRHFRVRLLMLEVWGLLFQGRCTESELVRTLSDHTSIDPLECER